MTLRIIFFFVSLFCSSVVFSQNTIVGKVVDDKQQPLPFVNVLLKDLNADKLIKYTSTDKEGKFSIEVNNTENMCLEFTSIGFKKMRKKLTDDMLRHVFVTVLVREDNMLDEVVINPNEGAIRMKNDTVVYKTSFFTDGTEINVESMLAKLPGFDVSDEGRISVGGKEVERIMVEGDDFFDKKYKLLSKNMPSYPIKEVEVIQNDNNNRLLKGIQNTDKIALNLRLSDKVKNIWFGNIRTGGGTNKKYAVNTNVMNFNKFCKIYFLGNVNNVMPGGDGDLDIKGSEEDDIPGVMEKPHISDVLDLFSAYTVLGNKNIFYDTKYSSLNTILKPNDKTSVKVGCLVGYDKQNYRENASSYTEIGNVNFTNVSHNDMVNRAKSLSGKVEVERNISDDKSLKLRTSGGKSRDRSVSSLIFNESSSNEFLNSDNSSFEQSVSFTFKPSEKRVLLLTGHFLFEEKPSMYNTDKFYMTDLFTDINPDDGIKQNVSQRLNNFEVCGTYINKFKNSTLLLQMGEYNSTEKLTSSLFSGNGVSVLRPDDFTNNLKYTVNNLYLYSGYELNIDNVRLSANVACSNYKLSYHTDSVTNRYKFSINPNMAVYWQLNKRNRLSLSYRYSSDIVGLSDLYGNNIVSGYRSSNRGYGKPVLLDNSIYFFNYLYGLFSDNVMANITGYYLKYHDSFSYNTLLDSNHNINSRILTHGNYMFFLNGQVDYYIRSLNMNIKCKVNYSQNTFENFINNSDRRHIKSKNIGGGIELRSGNISGFNYNVGANMLRNVSQSELKNSYNSWESFAYMGYNFMHKLNVKVKYNNYFYSKNVSDKVYHFLTFGVNYNVIPKKLLVSLEGSNLLGTDNYMHADISDISRSYTWYDLQPRSVMLYLEYRF